MKKSVLPLTDSNKTLSFSTNDNYFYHGDNMLNKTNYVNYLLGNSISNEELFQIFEAKIFIAKDGTRLPYRIYIPYNYDSNKKYPVLTLLHGAGSRGTDNKLQFKNGFERMFSQTNAPILDSIVVAPQCPSGNKWVDTPWTEGNYSIKSVAESNELRAVMELLELVEKSYSTDLDRYYVMGQSMGGFGAWDLLMRHSERFAAGVVMCGGGDPTMADTLKDMPIYAIHGNADPTVPVSGTREMVSALKNAGSTVIIYEELPGVKHNAWDYTYPNAKIQQWLFEQTRLDRSF